MNTEDKFKQLLHSTIVPQRTELQAELKQLLAAQPAKSASHSNSRLRWAVWLAIPTAAVIATVVFMQPQAKPNVTQISLKPAEALAASLKTTFGGEGTKHVVTNMVRDDSGKVYNRVQKEYYINSTAFWLAQNETFDQYPTEHNDELTFSTLDTSSDTVTDCRINIGTDLLDHTSATGLETKALLQPLLTNKELCNSVSSDQNLQLFAEPSNTIAVKDLGIEQDERGFDYLTFTTSEPVQSNLLSVATMPASSIDEQMWVQPSVYTQQLSQGDAFSESDEFTLHNEPVERGYKQRVQFVFMGTVRNGDNAVDITNSEETQVQFVQLNSGLTQFDNSDNVLAATPIISVKSTKDGYILDTVDASVINTSRAEAAKWSLNSESMLSNIVGGNALLQYMTEANNAEHRVEGEYDVYVAQLPPYGDANESYTVYVHQQSNILSKIVDRVTYPEGETNYVTTFDTVETLPGNQTELLNEDQFYAKAQTILDKIDH